MAFVIVAKCKADRKYLVHVPIIDCYLKFETLKDARMIARQVKRML